MSTWWRDDAACAGQDPETFFPLGHGAPAVRAAERARDVCWSCPVRMPCLHDALAAEDGAPPYRRHGIRGGLDSNQRWRIQQQITARKDIAA